MKTALIYFSALLVACSAKYPGFGGGLGAPGYDGSESEDSSLAAGSQSAKTSNDFSSSRTSMASDEYSDTSDEYYTNYETGDYSGIEEYDKGILEAKVSFEEYYSNSEAIAFEDSSSEAIALVEDYDSSSGAITAFNKYDDYSEALSNSVPFKEYDSYSEAIAVFEDSSSEAITLFGDNSPESIASFEDESSSGAITAPDKYDDYSGALSNSVPFEEYYSNSEAIGAFEDSSSEALASFEDYDSSSEAITASDKYDDYSNSVPFKEYYSNAEAISSFEDISSEAIASFEDYDSNSEAPVYNEDYNMHVYYNPEEQDEYLLFNMDEILKVMGMLQMSEEGRKLLATISESSASYRNKNHEENVMGEDYHSFMSNE